MKNLDQLEIKQSDNQSPQPGDVTAKLNQAFQIIAFDWDGTAVENRQANASEVGLLLESLMKLGVRIAIITGTNFNNIDRQFCSNVHGPHKTNLFVCANRGSEVYGFDASSNPVLIYRREASRDEDILLTTVAEAVRDEIKRRSEVDVAIVYNRLNRRKIDLIPVPEWADPPKSRIGELLTATEDRLTRGGLKGGIKEAYELAEYYSVSLGLVSAKITSDVKHIEVGLTDKSDSVAWVIDNLAKPTGIPLSKVLFLGDEFGPIAGFDGSDFKMVTTAARGAVYVSVGPEPSGVPAEVIHLGGGSERFKDLMSDQIALRGDNPA